MADDNIFYSRRNRVWLEDGRVHKLILPRGDCPDINQAARYEAEILKYLRGKNAAVPRVYSADGNLLVIEYIKGVTLTEEIEKIERTETGDNNLSADALAKNITRWFADFYAAFPGGRTRGDVNCRNFILTPDSRVFGVDFEELPHGSKETDLGRLTAFILTYDPPYTAYKINLAQKLTECFCQQFELDPELALQIRARETEAAYRRRQR